MALVFETSFEGTGVESGWAQLVGTGCTLDWDNTDIVGPHGGGTDLLKSVSAASGYEALAYVDLGAGSGIPKSYNRFNVLVSAEGLGNNELKPLALAWNNSALVAYRIDLYQSVIGLLYLTLTLYNNTTLNYYFQLILKDLWFLVEVMYDDNNNLWEYKVNGITIASGSLVGDHRTEIRFFAYGWSTPALAETGTAYFDNIKVDNAAWPGWPGFLPNLIIGQPGQKIFKIWRDKFRKVMGVGGSG